MRFSLRVLLGIVVILSWCRNCVTNSDSFFQKERIAISIASDIGSVHTTPPRTRRNRERVTIVVSLHLRCKTHVSGIYPKVPRFHSTSWMTCDLKMNMARCSLESSCIISLRSTTMNCPLLDVRSLPVPC